MKYPSHVRVGDYRVLMHDDNRNAEKEIEYLFARVWTCINRC